MRVEVIEFGVLPIYRSYCHCCHSLLEYDGRSARYEHNNEFPEYTIYIVECPACHAKNEFYGSERECCGEIKLTTPMDHYK